MKLLEFRAKARGVTCDANYIVAKAEAVWCRGTIPSNDDEHIEYQCYCNVHGHTKTHPTPEQAIHEFDKMHGDIPLEDMDIESQPAFLRKIMD